MLINDAGAEYNTLGYCEHSTSGRLPITLRLNPEKGPSITTARVTVSPSLVEALVARAFKRVMPPARSIT